MKLDRGWAFVTGALALLAIALFAGLVVLADGIRDRDVVDDTITVTGSARRQITSDFVVWNASITAQRPTTEAASKELATWTDRFRSFLGDQGAREDELTVGPVFTESVQKDEFSEGSQVTGYRLTRTFTIRSPRVDEVTQIVEASSRLLAEGIPIAAEQPQYVFTKLPGLRPPMLAEATKDAKRRAEVLVEATGGELGGLRTVSVGVFQITAPNSTEVSDYGVYDTTTIRKDVTAVVNVTFALT